MLPPPIEPHHFAILIFIIAPAVLLSAAAILAARDGANDKDNPNG